MPSQFHQVTTQNLFSIHMFSIFSQSVSQKVLIVSLMKYKQTFETSCSFHKDTFNCDTSLLLF